MVRERGLKPAVALARRALALLAVACALLAGPASAAGVTPAEPVHEITTVRGDTLIGLGRRFLVNPAAWPELARANALRDPNRIATGTVLRVPLRLMRTEAVSATLVNVVGQASTGGSALQRGQTVPEGGLVATGSDGHVTIRLVDGTLLRLRPDSRLLVRESRRVPDAGAVRSGARLQQGRVEVEAAPVPAGRPGFTIDTPQGVLGVRGTEFRVLVDLPLNLTRGEVLGGSVAFDGARGAERVGAGYGSVIGGDGQVAAPVRLLPRPDTTALPALQERLLMRFALPPQPGAAAWRGQIARDAAFEQVVADLTSATPELRFAELPDGDYFLRVRAIDGRGLEGQDTDHPFRLKARPEAPLPQNPPPRAVSFGGRVDFAWAANAEAASYRLRLSTDPGFKTVYRDLTDLRDLATTLEGLPPGTWHWQLASRRADGDQGPWGEVRSFELRPLPPAPRPPAVGDQGVSFSWEGAPGQTFEFQVARDAAFTNLVLERKLQTPGIELPLPGTGRFYVRLRAIDPDGFVGPYTTPQYFEVPNCLRDGGGACVRSGEQTLNLGP
jgi:hypothetical protein